MNNPLTRWQSIKAAAWNGLVAKPNTFPITKESTQNPAIEAGTKSPGTLIPFAQPVPTPYTGFSQYDMSPANGRHWAEYISNFYGKDIPSRPLVNPANVLMAVSKEADHGSFGPQDPWGTAYHLTVNQRKGYDPNNSYNQFTVGANGSRTLHS